MNYLIILVVKDYRRLLQTLNSLALIGAPIDYSNPNISVDLNMAVSNVKISLKGIGNNLAMCSVDLISEPMKQDLLIGEVLVLLNNYEFNVTAGDVLMYRKVD